MASQTSIANRALAELGITLISSVTDGSKSANLINEVWDDMVIEVLESHRWSFAKKWVAVAVDASYTFIDEDWDYAYAKPSDYVRMSKLEERTSNFAIRGEYIMSNLSSPLNFEYIYNLTDTTKWPQHFINAIIGKLKSIIATPLVVKRGNKTNEDFLAIYLEVILPKAKSRDGEEGYGESDIDKGKHVESNDTWLQSR